MLIAGIQILLANAHISEEEKQGKRQENGDESHCPKTLLLTLLLSLQALVLLFAEMVIIEGVREGNHLLITQFTNFQLKI